MSRGLIVLGLVVAFVAPVAAAAKGRAVKIHGVIEEVHVVRPAERVEHVVREDTSAGVGALLGFLIGGPFGALAGAAMASGDGKEVRVEHRPEVCAIVIVATNGKRYRAGSEDACRGRVGLKVVGTPLDGGDVEWETLGGTSLGRR